ncbi:MAG: hypothetical protein B6I38_11880 [Anaerolineaceae bacterium 4572_5.1]|nr:MAG: hypothetical protein B6I38_11880 [Anaerolineaceae bacterium 4572_5.1]
MIFDISRSLSPVIAVWPGDTSFSLKHDLKRSQGDLANLSTLTLSAHTGAHIDAPCHFSDDVPAIDKLPLSTFWGVARIVTVNKADGPLTPDDFAGVDFSLAPRLLIHSPASESDPARFPEKFIYPAPELADFLGAQGIILLGVDAPSVDPVESKTLTGHHALLKNNIAILEGLILRGVPDGIYELVALPLKIVGGDGSPVRAALRVK